MKVKTKKQIAAERERYARMPIKKLTHLQLAELIIEQSKFYGWHTIKNLLKWYRERRTDPFGKQTRIVSAKSKAGKLGHSIRELKDYYKAPHAPGVNARAKNITIAALLEVDYEALRWVARNLGKSHCERHYKSPQFKFMMGPWGKVIEEPTQEELDNDIPAPVIGSPKNMKKYRELVPPTEQQLKSWLKQSKKNRKLGVRRARKIKFVRNQRLTARHVAQTALHVFKARAELEKVQVAATKRLLKERKLKTFGTLPTTATNRLWAVPRAV